MNINYSLLWIDDSDDFVDATRGSIERTVRENYMVPRTKTYQFFDKFKEGELDHFDLDVFNLYDIILVDYALSGVTGDEIIREIRSRNIFTDIVFYSSNYVKMKREIKEKDHLEGVFLAERENLSVAVNKIIKKNLKREYSVPNVRGIIMDGTSEFDFICRTVSLALFDKLTPEKQQDVFQKVVLFVDNAAQKSNGNFSALSSLVSRNKYREYIKEALFSVDYVMDNKDRYELLSLIVKEFELGEKFGGSFAQEYYDSLIKPRNDLAHNKLYYGECKKKLHIAKKREQSACNKDCEKCSSKYDIAKCEEIRKKIYEYYLLFSDVNNKIN